MNVSALISPIVLIVIFYFFLIRSQQKRVKEHREMISRIKAGQEITTIGGIKGTTKAVDRTAVVITVGGYGAKMTFEKSAIK